MSATPILQVRNLGKRFGNRSALEGVSFSLGEGEALCVLGHNGAGKTTLLRCIAGLSKHTEGSVEVLGTQLSRGFDRSHGEVAGKVALVSHGTMLYGDLTPLENLELFGKLYGVKDSKARALDLLRAVGLAHRRYDLVRTFSRGMAQRVSIARALMADPKLLLLDEPYSGLDPQASMDLGRLLDSLRPGRGLVMVSHDPLRDVPGCTQALVLAKGRPVLLARDPESRMDEILAACAQESGADRRRSGECQERFASDAACGQDAAGRREVRNG